MSHESEPQEAQDPKTHWLETKRTGNRIFWGLVALCAALGLADFVYHRHTVFDFEAFPAVYGIFGFVACVFIVFAGIGLRKLIMRDEDYYDR